MDSIAALARMKGLSIVKPSADIFSFVGWLCEIFFCIATILQVETTEAFIRGIQLVSLSPDWSIIFQMPQFLFGELPIFGKLPISMQGPALVGWGVELVSFIVIIGLNKAHGAVSASHIILGRIFKISAGAITALNIYTDIHNGPAIGQDLQGHAVFMFIMAFGVFFCGVVGWHFIEVGKNK